MACYLTREQPDLGIALVESRSRWGGLISTLREEGFVCERGPIVLDRLDSGLLSPGGRQRARLEPSLLPLFPPAEESVHDFFTRRFGKQVTECLAAPVVVSITNVVGKIVVP